jgi:glycine/D-amino acid oxidase-like deaminating enzyme
MTRRTALGATIAAVAAPALAQTGRPAQFDIVIVGAGAAGLAAARKLTAAGRSVAVFEAMDRIGGRCTTETTTFGIPYDRGAHWLHMPDINPVAQLGAGLGFDIYPAPDRQALRIGRREARTGELEAWFAALSRAGAAISAAAQKTPDRDCLSVVPRTLGDWRESVAFVLGPFGCAKDLADVSVYDFAMSAERDIDAFCRQGFGTLLAQLGADVPVRLSSPVQRIDWSKAGPVELSGPFGTVRALQVIVTASTNVVASGRIAFQPALPVPLQDAHAKLTLGTYNHIALEIPGGLPGVAADTLVFARGTDRRQGGMLAHMGGSDVSLLDIGGSFGLDLEKAGEADMVAFARDWVGAQFGAETAAAIRRTHATRWGADPWVLGAYSCAPPGEQPMRKVLMQPVGNRIWFAGEAAHETLWGTVAGAWESGERAAGDVLQRLPRPRQPRERRG